MNIKAVLLKRGVAVVSRKDGGTYVFITSSKTVDWWMYLYRNLPVITDFIIKHCKQDTIVSFLASVQTHDSDSITVALHKAFDEAPDDVADVRHTDLATFTVIGRLMEDFQDGGNA